ncbi:MAG: hypothetical protein GY849_21025 [Deltaproteobacteria bacterium]|nr:hypothetical protein [Deltaproteobacteria bacterium]
MANKYYAPVRRQQSVITPMVAGFAMDLIKQKIGAGQAAKLSASEQAAQTARSESETAGKKYVADRSFAESGAKNKTEMAKANLQHTIALKEIELARQEGGRLQQELKIKQDAIPQALKPKTPEGQMLWESGVKAEVDRMSGGDKGLQKTLTLFFNASKNLTSQGTNALTQFHHFSSPAVATPLFRDANAHIQKEMDKAMQAQDTERIGQLTEVAKVLSDPEALMRQVFPGVTTFQLAQKEARAAKAGAPKLSTLGTLRHERSELEPGDKAGLAEYNQRIAKENMPSGSKRSIEVSPEGGFTISEQSGSGLTQGSTTSLQKAQVKSYEQLDQVEALSKAYAPEYLTYFGKGKRFTLRQMSAAGFKLTDENREYVGKSREFFERIESLFNAYRHDITGAQAAMKEIKMLRESITNKNLVPDEFEYSVKRYTDTIKTQIRMRNYLMEKGFNNKPKNKDGSLAAGHYGETLNDLWRSRTIKPIGEAFTDEEMDVRGDEIKRILSKQKNISEQDLEETTVKMLREEGYL